MKRCLDVYELGILIFFNFWFCLASVVTLHILKRLAVPSFRGSRKRSVPSKSKVIGDYGVARHFKRPFSEKCLQLMLLNLNNL